MLNVKSNYANRVTHLVYAKSVQGFIQHYNYGNQMRTEGSAGTYKRTVTMDIDIKIYLNWTNNIFWLPAYFPYPYNNVANFYN